MAKRGIKSELIRRFILSAVGREGKDLASLVSKEFEMSRQAVSKHLKKLVGAGELLAEGSTRLRSYRLKPIAEVEFSYEISPGLEEDQSWRGDVAPLLSELPRNVLDIWHFCFTEMFNNAVDHSEGKEIRVTITLTAVDTHIFLTDDGIGIFRKIQTALKLIDEKHAVLELAKGKLTTDPSRHTGQGIFFTSRLVDTFHIFSGNVEFSHGNSSDKDFIMDSPEFQTGTLIAMRLDNNSTRVDKLVFDQYSSGEDYGFTKTVVPVKLAQYGEEKLVSRSQAKRMLARVDLFMTVLFDFEGVVSIGQAFADEIFRVFARSHPEIELIPINTATEVQQQIQSARSQLARDGGGI